MVKIDSPNSNPVFIKDYEQLKSKKGIQPSKESEQTSVRSTDRIEISPEAKMLNSQNVQSKDFEQINNRIKSNYYNSDEALEKIADAIAKDLDDKKQQ